MKFSDCDIGTMIAMFWTMIVALIIGPLPWVYFVIFLGLYPLVCFITRMVWFESKL